MNEVDLFLLNLLIRSSRIYHACVGTAMMQLCWGSLNAGLHTLVVE